MTVSFPSATTPTTFVSPPNSPPSSRDTRYQKGGTSLGDHARTEHVFRSTGPGTRLTIFDTEAVRLERRAITDLRLDLVASPEVAVVTYAFVVPVALGFFPAIVAPVLLPTAVPLMGFYYYRCDLFDRREKELYNVEKRGLDMGFTQVEAVEYAACMVVQRKTHDEAVNHIQELRRQKAN